MGKSSVLSDPSSDSDRPRTRSVVSSSDIPVKSPLSGRKKAKGKAAHVTSRSKSPIIDLSDDLDHRGKSEGVDESESPLKHVKRKNNRGGTPKRRKKNSKSAKKELMALTTTVAPSLGFPENHSELNSSPIKPFRLPKEERSGSSQNGKEERSSSPIKEERSSRNGNQDRSSSPTKKKSVAFSDIVVQECPSSPCRMPDLETVTPRKSILKNIHYIASPADTDSPLSKPGYMHSSQPEASLDFWQPGTIVQLEPKSPEIPRLVAQSLQALKSGDFQRKFEVYASLNLVFKHNVVSTIHDIFVRQVPRPEIEDTDYWRDSGILAGFGKVPGVSGSENVPETVPRALEFFAYAQRDVQLLETRLFGETEVKKEGELAKLENSEQNGQSSEKNAQNGGNSGKNEDIGASISTFDPFEARTLTQALKFMAHFLAIPSLSQILPPQTIRWCYIHCCELLMKPNLSKSLVSSYICMIKDFNFPSKQKRAIFDPSVPEHVLSTLLNMQSFMSSSLINEKFIAMRNLISNFPAIMAKTFHHWFPGLIMNLCDLSFVLYYKIVGTGIVTLLEAARNFLDSPDICQMTRKFLESPAESEKSWVSESSLSLGSFRGQMTLNFLMETLKQLCSVGQYKYAMDIWVGISLLLGNFQKWPHLTSWFKIQKLCFTEKSVGAKEIAISSWKVVIYRMCQEISSDMAQEILLSPKKPVGRDSKELDEADPKKQLDGSVRANAKLLVVPFMCSTSNMPDELVLALHNSFVSVLYTLLNKHSKHGVRVVQAIWDRVIHPVMVNFYFRKQAGRYMQEFGSQVLCRLLKPSPPDNEKHFNGLRCLWNETIPLAEINCLSPKWVFLRFDKVLRLLSVLLQSSELSPESKMAALTSFLNSIKFVTKKEVSASDNTYDIIDNLPQCMETFFERSKVGYEDVFKLLVNLNDTFGASNLVSGEKNVYQAILSHCVGLWSPQQLNAVLSMIFGAIGERKSFRFFSILEKVEKKVNRPDILAFLSDMLNQKRYAKFSNSELVVLGRIFTRLDSNFNAIAKKAIQHIVLLKAEDFDEMVVRLNIVSWNVQIFSFFVVLMHNAPYSHLNRATVQLIKERGDFRDIFRLLIEYGFDSEILAVKDVLGKHVLGPETEATLWNYLKGHKDREFVDAVLSEGNFERDIEEIVNGQWDQFPLLKADQERKRANVQSFEIFDTPEKDSDASMQGTTSMEVSEKMETGEKRKNESSVTENKRRKVETEKMEKDGYMQANKLDSQDVESMDVSEDFVQVKEMDSKDSNMEIGSQKTIESREMESRDCMQAKNMESTKSMDMENPVVGSVSSMGSADGSSGSMGSAGDEKRSISETPKEGGLGNDKERSLSSKKDTPSSERKRKSGSDSVKGTTSLKNGKESPLKSKKSLKSRENSPMPESKRGSSAGSIRECSSSQSTKGNSMSGSQQSMKATESKNGSNMSDFSPGSSDCSSQSKKDGFSVESKKGPMSEFTKERPMSESIRGGSSQSIDLKSNGLDSQSPFQKTPWLYSNSEPNSKPKAEPISEPKIDFESQKKSSPRISTTHLNGQLGTSLQKSNSNSIYLENNQQELHPDQLKSGVVETDRLESHSHIPGQPEIDQSEIAKLEMPQIGCGRELIRVQKNREVIAGNTDERIGNRMQNLHALITAIGEDELATMTNSEKFALETGMLELMLRMRRS